MSKIICIEGPVYSGKTVTIDSLVELISERGKKCVVLRSPGASKRGEEIRSILNDKDADIPSADRRSLFYEAYTYLLSDIEESMKDKSIDYIILDRIQPVSETVHGAYNVVSDDGKSVSYTEDADFISKAYSKDNSLSTDVFVLMPNTEQYINRIEQRGVKEKKYFDYKPISEKMDNYVKYQYLLDASNKSENVGSSDDVKFALDVLPGRLIRVDNSDLSPREIADAILTYVDITR